MKPITPLLILLAMAQLGLAQLSGPLSGTLGPGTFHVVDTISVEAGDSLTLLPGTTFTFDGPFPFRIYGTLLAEGTETDSIIFTTDTSANPDRWRGLRFSDTTSSSSRLGYCRIERGYATGGWLDNIGGGVCLVYLSSPSFANCIITGNRATSAGGGVSCWIACSPTFANCTFAGNTAGGEGGGISFGLGCSLTFENCTFTTNAGSAGAAVFFSSNDSATFENCIICNNWSVSGGAVEGSGSAKFTNCEINGNSGRGVDCSGSANFTNCQINGNSGEGVWCQGSATFTNCEFNGNSGGGAFCEYTQSMSFVNCVFWGNAEYGVYNWGASPSLIHCSIVGTVGTGVVCFYSAAPTLNSTVIAFSQGRGIYFLDDCSASQIEYCDIFGNSGGDIQFYYNDPSYGPPGIGILDSVNANGDGCDIYSNILLNPHFMDYASNDLHLRDSSWCLGAGDPANPPPTDIEGNPRPNPADSHPDIGAYESEQATPPEGLCGALSGTLGQGTFPVTCTISVSAGDTLQLLPGTVLFFEASFAFEIEGTLLAEGTESDSIVFTTDTLINMNRWRGLRFLGTESSNSRLAYSRIECAHASDSGPYDNGGGLYFDHSSPALANCTIVGNVADNAGGGMYCTNSSPSLTNCTITGNSSATNGGGLFCVDSSPTLTQSNIRDNVAANDGGAVRCDSSSPSFIGCVISGNTANEGDGGGICCLNNSSPTFANSTIADNVAAGFGGGVHCENNSSPSFENSTITSNIAAGSGGGVHCENNSSPTFETSSIAGNSATGDGGGVCCLRNSSPLFFHCVIGANSGTGAYACGGGVYFSFSSPVFTGCTFTGNSSGGDGGGVGCWSTTSATLTRCVIMGNSASGNGAGVYCRASAATLFTQCTIVVNTAGGDGGGMYCHTSSPIINSTVFAFSEGAGIYFSASPDCQVIYCSIFGNSDGAIQGVGIPDTLAILTPRTPTAIRAMLSSISS